MAARTSTAHYSLISKTAGSNAGSRHTEGEITGSWRLRSGLKTRKHHDELAAANKKRHVSKLQMCIETL